MLKLTRLGIATMPVLPTVILTVISTEIFTRPAVCLAVDVFRVTSHVYANDEPAPIKRSETLCESNTVYDLTYDPAVQSAPTQVTVYKRTIDGRAERFILLNPDRRLRTEPL